MADIREFPTTFAVIPASVRYDDKLTPNAKLLYGEITALSNKYGVCWANNEYFAKLYGTTDKTIRRWIGSLEEAGYIEREIVYKEGTKEVKKRYLKLSDSQMSSPRDKNVPTPRDKNVPTPRDKNVPTPRDKNVLENNTSIINNININNKEREIYKEKEKTNDTDSIINSFEFEKELRDSVSDWIAYKKEKKQSYQPKGLEILLKKIKKESETYGSEAIVSAIEYSMSNSYQGIVWDRLKASKPSYAYQSQNNSDNAFDFLKKG